MKVLIVGRGGREHALCEKVAASPRVREVFVTPGNPGMSVVATILPYGESDHREIVDFCKLQRIDLVIIGPEKPLVEGLSDRLTHEGICVFAPSQRAAQIEGSKSFAKDLMTKYNIPTGKYQVFSDFSSAQKYVESSPLPVVIKADGLASGKGVVIATTRAEAVEALQKMMVEKRFGSASSQVVIEEFLEGEEFSLMALVHGELVVPLDVAQDHKKAFEGDQGPNTGGMGAYSPVPQISSSVVADAVATIVEPTARALVQGGMPFTGILYAGLIVTKEGAKVIEFNARLGDPETQVLLPRLESDLVEVIGELLSGKKPELRWSSKAVVGVVVASQGYPDSFTPGVPLPSFAQHEAVHIYYSGVTQNDSGELLSDGGRVYLAACEGDTLGEARQKVYDFLESYRHPNLFYRTDIAYRALSRGHI